MKSSAFCSWLVAGSIRQSRSRLVLNVGLNEAPTEGSTKLIDSAIRIFGVAGEPGRELVVGVEAERQIAVEVGARRIFGVDVQYVVQAERARETGERQVESDVQIGLAGVERDNAVLNIEADMQRGRDGGMDIPGRAGLQKCIEAQIEAEGFGQSGERHGQLVVAVVRSALRLAVNTGFSVLENRGELLQPRQLLSDQRQADRCGECIVERRLIRREGVDEVLRHAQHRALFQDFEHRASQSHRLHDVGAARDAQYRRNSCEGRCGAASSWPATCETSFCVRL